MRLEPMLIAVHRESGWRVGLDGVVELAELGSVGWAGWAGWDGLACWVGSCFKEHGLYSLVEIVCAQVHGF